MTSDKPKGRKDEQWKSEEDTVEKRDREGLPAGKGVEETNQEPGIGSRESGGRGQDTEAAREAGGQAEGRRAKRGERVGVGPHAH